MLQLTLVILSSVIGLGLEKNKLSLQNEKQKLQDQYNHVTKIHDVISVKRSNKAVSGVCVNQHLREPSLSSAG